MAFIDSGMDVNQIGPGVGTAGGPLNLLSQPGNNAGGIASLFSNNPSLLATLGLGGAAALSLTQANRSLPYSGDLTGVVSNLNTTAGQASTEASTLFGFGNELISPLITGKLPAGADAEVQNFIKQQTAQTKSRYASLGQTGSTMETDALNTIQTNAAALRFQIAQQMAQQGLQATAESLQGLNITQQAYGDTANIYSALMKAQMQQDQNTMSAISGFAGALGKAFGMGGFGGSGAGSAGGIAAATTGGDAFLSDAEMAATIAAV